MVRLDIYILILINIVKSLHVLFNKIIKYTFLDIFFFYYKNSIYFAT